MTSEKGDTLRSILPPIYGKMLGEELDRPAVVEERATCSNCAMCDQGQGPQSVQRDYFKPDLKCCTYYPMLPNYLVGAIFSDPDPALEEGRRRLRERIAAKVGITPRWIAPSRKYSVLMEAMHEGAGFGRSAVLVCPYLEREKGLCTIWRHRDSVCSTYFCKYTGGARGSAFWNAMKQYIGYTEFYLSRWLTKQIDPTLGEPQLGRLQLTLEDLEDRPPPDDEYARWWGAWAGREEAFYVACHAEAQKLTHERYLADVLTPDAKKWLEQLGKRHDELHSNVLPARLVRNPKMRVIPAEAEGAMVVTTYNRFDSFALESDLYDVLRHFDPAETVDQVLAKLKEQGIELAPELLFALYAHAVLVPPPDGEEPLPEVTRAP